MRATIRIELNWQENRDELRSGPSRYGDEVRLDVQGRSNASWVEGTGTPPVEEGRLQVVSVHPDHSSAQIIDMRNPIFERGLRVRIDRRMP